ncbi:hypothetical protein PIB30_059820 [Stylosanthes scabra]|uniref:Zinc finger GRF-type domain-containing protein n=1 Tax=Stylosanthes scabra TaxID=79078 RepID=A0ABU6RLH6_9FABA|nr:hypothetical protein [Stylosanthes scabra]
MQGNNSQGSGCSSWSRSHSSWVRTSSRGRVSKVLQWCGCGLRPVLRWSGTEQNPDRPFYGCPNYNNMLMTDLWAKMVWAFFLDKWERRWEHGTEGTM